MKIKYICFSNEVISRDGDIHLVHARYLPRLYKVDPNECVFVTTDSGLIGLNLENHIHLNPKSDGRYYDASEVHV